VNKTSQLEDRSSIVWLYEAYQLKTLKGIMRKSFEVSFLALSILCRSEIRLRIPRLWSEWM
jgi:hypothetical protein